MQKAVPAESELGEETCVTVLRFLLTNDRGEYRGEIENVQCVVLRMIGENRKNRM